MAKYASAAVSLGLGATILYLSAQAVTGPQGLMAFVDMQEREQALSERLDDARAEQAALEARLARLDPTDPDIDYLDERARLTLASQDPNEVVFRLDGGS
jgi:cell division protein FtsB